jgi:uncharacterized membrane protein (GlpM family)
MWQTCGENSSYIFRFTAHFSWKSIITHAVYPKNLFFFLKRSLEISCATTVELIIVHQRFSSQMLTNGSYFWLDNNH